MADLPPLREVISRHGLDALRMLGQNFLLDLNLTGRIARSAGTLAGHTVIEVGPGPGGLTRALLAEGATKVIAIELDRRAIAALHELAVAYPSRLEVIEGDALRQDMVALAGSGPARIVANLPYNIATPLLISWLPHVTRFESLTLMFQREVAERLAAEPRTKAYGRLSIAAQWRCAVKLLFDVPPQAFVPQPKVTSSVVQLLPRAEPLAPADPATLERVVATAFNQRRKMLRAALKPLRGDAEAWLMANNIDPTRRAEELSVAEFCALARTL